MQITNITAHDSSSPAAADNSGATTNKAATDPLASTDTFLQLLVAQIKNQDPTQPTDPTQFLSELAQFSQLDQLIGIRQGVDTLNTPVTGGASSGSGTTPTTN